MQQTSPVYAQAHPPTFTPAHGSRPLLPSQRLRGTLNAPHAYIRLQSFYFLNLSSV